MDALEAQSYQRSLSTLGRVNLREELTEEGRERWLDIGSGGNFSPGFDYLDVFPEGLVDPRYRRRYRRLDIVSATDEQLADVGTYDLVRMQHTLEHFTFEDGQRVLLNAARLLTAGGLILITVPDLRVHVEKYLADDYGSMGAFRQWAVQRIPADAPASAHFSVFAHSVLFEPHRWCYDYEGVAYGLARVGMFGRIREIKPDDELASVPFTHNRPEEDLCVLAERLP
jgi:predicted SAM-dependent methyltransferase